MSVSNVANLIALLADTSGKIGVCDLIAFLHREKPPIIHRGPKSLLLPRILRVHVYAVPRPDPREPPDRSRSHPRSPIRIAARRIGVQIWCDRNRRSLFWRR